MAIDRVLALTESGIHEGTMTHAADCEFLRAWRMVQWSRHQQAVSLGRVVTESACRTDRHSERILTCVIRIHVFYLYSSGIPTGFQQQHNSASFSGTERETTRWRGDGGSGDRRCVVNGTT